MVAATIVGLRIIHAGVHAPPAPHQQATHPAATTTTLPLSSAARSFLGYAQPLQAANTAASQALAALGSSPSVTQVSAVMNSYDQSVNVYYFELHFVVYPATATTDAQNEYVQLRALQAVLKGDVFLTPARMSSYLTLFKSTCATVEKGDNALRKDLGLPSTTTFP